MPRLSFTGSRFELTGIPHTQTALAGFHWDSVMQIAWTGLDSVAEKFKQYDDGSAKQKFEAWQRGLQEWPIRHKELLDRFLEITERKVLVLDDYGDENWDALPKEIARLLLKTAKADKENIDPIRHLLFKGVNSEEILQIMDNLKVERRLELSRKGFNRDLIKKYTFLRSDLEARFRAHHSEHESKGPGELLDSLTGVEFERYLMKLLKEHGFDDVRTTVATGDQGADLVARLNGRTIVIQAKRYQGSVGNRAVQEVAGAVRYYRADEAWVITSGTFTPSAKELAQANDVKLIDGYALRNRRFPVH